MAAQNVTWPRLEFWQKLYADPATGCWLWTGRRNRDGYGAWTGGRMVHRVTYHLLVAPIPPGYQVHHHCLVRACANPAHLEAVTPQENNRLRWEGRRSKKRHCISCTCDR